MYVYFFVMYILWGMTYTVMDIPYWSMLPSLSSTKEERDSIKVITGNDQLKVFIGVVLCYNLVVQLAGGIAIYYFKYDLPLQAPARRLV